MTLPTSSTAQAASVRLWVSMPMVEECPPEWWDLSEAPDLR
jgi:hypothetical protein